MVASGCRGGDVVGRDAVARLGAEGRAAIRGPWPPTEWEKPPPQAHAGPSSRCPRTHTQSCSIMRMSQGGSMSVDEMCPRERAGAEDGQMDGQRDATPGWTGRMHTWRVRGKVRRIKDKEEKLERQMERRRGEEQANGWKEGWTDGQRGGRNTHRNKGGEVDGGTEGKKDQEVNKQKEGWVGGWKDGWKEGWLDRRKERRLVGWRACREEGRVDGWTDSV